MNLTNISFFCVIAPVQFISEPTDKEVVLGESVEFSCSAQGFPTPVIRWIKLSGTLWRSECVCYRQSM